MATTGDDTLSPLTTDTCPPAALEDTAGSRGPGGKGAVEAKLLIHQAGRSLREHQVQQSHCADEENESWELAVGQGYRVRHADPQTPKLDKFFLLDSRAGGARERTPSPPTWYLLGSPSAVMGVRSPQS